MQISGTTLPSIPPPAEKRIALRVTTTAERAIKDGHPWLFENSITKQSWEGKPGDLAVIFDKEHKFMAIGLYDPTSFIRVRILHHHNPQKIDTRWFSEKIRSAAKIRAGLPPNTNGYRLIHGENDGLPGLVIDCYANSLVIKLYTLAWIPYLGILIYVLDDLFKPNRIVLRLNRRIQHYPQYLYNLKDGTVIFGVPLNEAVCFIENGIIFEADLTHGQKTGFFLDQRDNRARIEKISKGKRVLNIFSYTGGFSLYAARGGADEVISVDISQPALEAAKRNFIHNQANAAVKACQHKIFTGDAFKSLQYFAHHEQLFDLLIIDPPTFAKKDTEVKKAIAAYQHLTRLGVKVLVPGGTLVQSSCSNRVSPKIFFNAIHQAAYQVKHPLREIERTSHPIDHPIRFPEGEYLKCLFAVMEV